MVEETAPLAQEHRDDMEFELVEDAGSEHQPCGPGALDEHVVVARGLLGLGHGLLDVAHIGNQRPLAPLTVARMTGNGEDRHAVVMITAPEVRRLDGPAAADDRSGGQQLIDDPAVDARRAARDALVVGAGAVQEPLVQAVPAVAERVVRSLVGPATNPSRDMDMRARSRTRRLLLALWSSSFPASRRRSRSRGLLTLIGAWFGAGTGPPARARAAEP